MVGHLEHLTSEELELLRLSDSPSVKSRDLTPAMIAVRAKRERGTYTADSGAPMVWRASVCSSVSSSAAELKHRALMLEE